MKKNIIWLISLIFGLLILPNFVLALGQMTEPIIIGNALRGESIQQELIAVNSDNSDIKVIFTAEGAIKDWAQFYLPNDLNNPVDTFVLPANGNLRVVSILEVPTDIENGEYKGIFGVSNIPSAGLEESESASNVTQKIDRQISITISDQEEVDIENTSIIPNKFDLDNGELLSVRVIYDNQGNIRLRPQLRIKIKKDDKNVYDIIHPYPEGDEGVSSKSQHEIDPIVIQTIGWENGRYLAFLEFSRGDEVLLEKDFVFSIADINEDVAVEETAKNYTGAILLVAFFLIVIVWQTMRKSKK